MPPKKRPLFLGCLYALLIFQILGTLFFVTELWSEVLGLRSWSLAWKWQEFFQIFASIALILGTSAAFGVIYYSRIEMRRMHKQIDVVSGQFNDHVRAQFLHWNFSRSEEAVAIFAMKGFSNSEIAVLRGTSAATVKSQMNAIFRKAGLSNRLQLIALLVEELLQNTSDISS